MGTIVGAMLLLCLLLCILCRKRWRRSGARARVNALIHFPPRRSSCFQLCRRGSDTGSNWDGHSITFAQTEKTPEFPEEPLAIPMVYPQLPREYDRVLPRATTAEMGEVIDITASPPRTPRNTSPATSIHDMKRSNRSALLDVPTNAHPYLSVPGSSPFALDLDQQLTAPTPAAALGHSRRTIYSFLDFASGSSLASRRETSSSSQHAARRHSPQHTSTGSSTRSRMPIPFTSLSTPSRRSASGSGSGSQSFPYPLQAHAAAEPPSPGNSIPLTVSDIYFRPQDDISVSDGGATRPTSVPYSERPRVVESPVPMFQSPASPVILQRLLGRVVTASETTGQARHGHSHSVSSRLRSTPASPRTPLGPRERPPSFRR
jgi:hypothetical protein